MTLARCRSVIIPAFNEDPPVGRSFLGAADWLESRQP
jgi:hypothetical protein